MRRNMTMRIMRFVAPGVVSIVICLGCSNSEPTGRLVICDHSGGIVGEVSFSARRPPSVDEISRRLDTLVPTLPKNGRAVRVAAAIMDHPSDEFRNSKTLADFEKSLTGSHTSCDIFPSFDAVDEKQGDVVWRHDPGKWTDKPHAWQLKDPNRSDHWRYVVAEEFAGMFLRSASSYGGECRLESSETKEL
jgi:hypothetical protein